MNMNNIALQYNLVLHKCGNLVNLFKGKKEAGNKNGEGVIDSNGDSRKVEKLLRTKSYMIENYGENKGVVGSVRDWEEPVNNSSSCCSGCCCSGCMRVV